MWLILTKIVYWICWSVYVYTARAMILLDTVDEMGSRSSLSRDLEGSDQWDMNYHEAAIFLEVIK